MAVKVKNPYELFRFYVKDEAVFNGSIYVGEPGQNPKQFPKQCSAVMADGSSVNLPSSINTPILKTSAGGVPVYNGTPVIIETDGDYSILIEDSNGAQVYYSQFNVDDSDSGGKNSLSFSDVTDMLDNQENILIGDISSTGGTNWERISISVTPTIDDFIPLYDVYVEDFNDGVMTQDEYVTMAHDYCMKEEIRAKLIFPDNKIFNFTAGTSFQIFVESGGWYCPGVCQLRWSAAPTAGYAINVLGRYTTSNSSYSQRVNDSNFRPMEGFTIGQNGSMLANSGLKIGHADERQSSAGVVVTSKFTVSRVTVIDFDDCIDLWNGSWSFKLHRVNTIGGSWRTPTFFNGIDFGENIIMDDCFIADNHTRVVDGEAGRVHLQVGEYVFMGGSFDNMRVTVDGDAVVKMHSPHFENPASTAKNKVFLEVVGDHCNCVIDSPTIVIRSTDIYSTLFHCRAGTDASRFPWSGGLTLNNPQFQSVTKYRPDLALVKSVEDGVTYEGDGFRELVGGGGRVYMTGQAFINSLYYTYFPIPLARNLIGRSLNNNDFEAGDVGSNPLYWIVESSGQYVGEVVKSPDYAWVGSHSCKMTAAYNGGETWSSARVHQTMSCSAGQLVLGNCKVKWVTELTNGATGPITGEVNIGVDFFDISGNYISTGWFDKYDVDGDSTGDYDGWLDLDITGHAPDGTHHATISMTCYSTSDNFDKKIHAYYDAMSFNVL